MSSPPIFALFDFLRLDPRFHSLQSNEKVVARQEFSSVFDSLQRNSAAITYCLTGLRSDSDILVCRLAENLEILQTAAERLRGCGLGRYLYSAHSLMTLPPKDYSEFGKGKYLFVQPASWNHEPHTFPGAARQEALAELGRLASRSQGLRIHLFESFGVEGHPCIVTYETDNPVSYAEFAHGLDNTPVVAALVSRAPVFPCIRRDIHDIAQSME